MKRRQRILGTICMLFCVAAITLQPVETSAATRVERNAYRAVFDADYYYNAYPDVAETCGKNETALFEHFVKFGVDEGRSASAEFNPQAYRQRYTDLQEVFGKDMAAYCRHYVNYGEKEGRNGAIGIQADGTPVLQPQIAESVSGAVIGRYKTFYVDNVPRAVNVKLAAQRINGIVVQSGENFSFSATVLPRTTANGYVEAPIFVSGKHDTGVGGGICQVSSTLYAAMVSAGLPATERHAHSLPVDYLPAGLDATIAGNYMDLKFTNTFSEPLLIQASAEKGVLRVTLVLQ